MKNLKLILAGAYAVGTIALLSQNDSIGWGAYLDLLTRGAWLVVYLALVVAALYAGTTRRRLYTVLTASATLVLATCNGVAGLIGASVANIHSRPFDRFTHLDVENTIFAAANFVMLVCCVRIYKNARSRDLTR